MSLVSLFALAYFLGVNALVHIAMPKEYPYPAALLVGCFGAVLIGVIS